MTAKRTSSRPGIRTSRSVTPPQTRSTGVVALAMPVLILAAGVWAYSTSLNGVFALDDVRAIARNRSITTLWPLTVPLSPPSETTVAGRPIANLSLAVTYALAPADSRDVFEPAADAPPGIDDRLRRNARAYHLGNLLIHLAAALALFGVVRRTLTTDRIGPVLGPSAAGIAGGVAIVWVVHPLTTAAVTYIVQRVESLMALFCLLTLYCAIRASADGSRRGPWMVAATASCALGMGTKETMVVAPVLVAAWLWVFRPRAQRGGHARLLMALAATWVILGALVSGERREPSIDLSPAMIGRYLFTQAEVIVHYLGQAFAPSSLVFLYDWPLVTTMIAALPEVLLLTVLVVLAAIGVARRQPWSFPAAAFFLVLAPSSSLLPIVTEVAAEHRMYLPLASVTALVVVGLFLAGRRLIADRRMAATTAIVATAAAAILLGSETRDRNRVYWSDEALWRDTVSKRPDDQRPRVAYGSVLAREGRLPEAEVQLHAAVTLAPEDPIARVRLASVLVRQGKSDAAIPHLERAMANRPDDPAAYRLLGQIHADRGEDALAVQHLGRALLGMGDDPALLVRLAMILADSRDVAVRDGARALDLAERAVSLTSGRDVWALTALALAQNRVGRYADATVTARRALELARTRGAGPDLLRRLEFMAGATAFGVQRPDD